LASDRDAWRWSVSTAGESKSIAGALDQVKRTASISGANLPAAARGLFLGRTIFFHALSCAVAKRNDTKFG